LGPYAFDSAAIRCGTKRAGKQGKTFIYNHTNREILDTSLVISTEETAKKESQMVMPM
jgi:glutamyl-tRNA synthetase